MYPLNKKKICDKKYTINNSLRKVVIKCLVTNWKGRQKKYILLNPQKKMLCYIEFTPKNNLEGNKVYRRIVFIRCGMS